LVVLAQNLKTLNQLGQTVHTAKTIIAVKKKVYL